MEHWGGGNVPVAYKTIAISAANQTYETQLTELKATYDTLTNDEKMRAAIFFDNKIFINGTLNGTFYRNAADTIQCVCQIMNFGILKYISVVTKTTGTTFDYSDSQSSTNPMYLMLLSNY